MVSFRRCCGAVCLRATVPILTLAGVLRVVCGRLQASAGASSCDGMLSRNATSRPQVSPWAWRSASHGGRLRPESSPPTANGASPPPRRSSPPASWHGIGGVLFYEFEGFVKNDHFQLSADPSFGYVRRCSTHHYSSRRELALSAVPALPLCAKNTQILPTELRSLTSLNPSLSGN